MKFRISFQISLLFVAGALNSGAIMLTGAVIQSPPDILFCFVLGFGLIALLWIIRLLFKHMNIIMRLALILLAPLLLWRLGIFTRLYDFFTQYANWLYIYDLSQPEYSKFGTISSQVMAGIASAIFSLTFVAVRPRMLITLLFYLVIIFSPYPYVDMPQFIVASNIVIIALLMLAVLSEYTRKAVRFGTKLSALPYQVIGIPVCALIILISTLFPWSEAGHPEKIPKGLIDFFNNGGLSLFSSEYKLNETGRVKLGGGNRMGKGLLFDIEAERPMYMYSTCYDLYTGSAWESTNDLLVNYSPQIYNLMEAGSNRLFMPEPEYTPFTVQYQNLSTDILLMPHHIIEPLIRGDGYEMTITLDMGFRVMPDAPIGMIYEAKANEQNINDIIETEKMIITSLGKILLVDEDIIVERLFERESLIRLFADNGMDDVMRLNDYLQLPDTVTTRTRALAIEVTMDKRTFVEKALAIEEYLSETYPYTLDSPRLPQNTDFVDFFLFEAKKGYCTSYASAMTVMLRILGIPARYCEGFAPSVDSEEKGVYQVFESDAHAWVEVFVPYIGWVEFDPTGSSNAGAYREIARATPTPLPTAMPSFTPTPTPEPEMPPEQTPAPAPQTLQNGTANDGGLPLTKILAVIGIVSASFIWIFCGKLYVRMTLAAVSRKHPNAQARFWYKRIGSLLKAERLVIQNYETMREFTARVQEHLPSTASEMLPAIAVIEKVRYNGGDVNESDLELLKTAHRQLASGLHAGWSPMRQRWETYVTMRLSWQ